LPLAQRSRRVIGIDEFAPAIENGQQNAWFNGFENIDWIAEPVERGLVHVYDVDAIVLDPPRKGLHPEVMMSISRLQPQRIVYVSCHPGTLARDVQAIMADGYALTSVSSVDCFPQTAHIESVLVLERTA
jgi:23S rRNA (uracil1939-C5)-methyltransferase